MHLPHADVVIPRKVHELLSVSGTSINRTQPASAKNPRLSAY